MKKEEKLALLNELLAAWLEIETLAPHFTNRRRIKELEQQIQNFK